MIVSVVICCYTDERWDQLRMAIESLRTQDVPATEVVVAVDYNDALLRRVTGAFPDAIVTANTGAKGLSGARNSGIAASRGEIVAFLDDDAIAAPDWLARLLPHYESPAVLGVGGLVGPIWTTARPRWFPGEFDWVVGCSYRGLPEHAAPVRNLIGCNMSFRRSVLETLGGFNSALGRSGRYPAGCEETELCIRALQAWPNGLIMHEPRARVRQWVPESRSRWRYFRRRCYAEGRSKATVSRLVGAGPALASERAYTLRVLPRGVLGTISMALWRGDRHALPRAGAIVAGLMLTAGGYLAGGALRFAQRRGSGAGSLPPSR